MNAAEAFEFAERIRALMAKPGGIIVLGQEGTSVMAGWRTHMGAPDGYVVLASTIEDAVAELVRTMKEQRAL
jgi:hypothetical protein